MRRRIALGLSFDPGETFKEFTAGFLHVPASGIVQVRANKPDRHVARAAVQYEATILTQDAELIVECQDDNILAQFPWQIITAQGVTPPVEEVIRIVRPSRQKGTIFARVTPGGWLGKRDVGEFTVADVENIGRLWFDSRSQEWVFDSAVSARMKFSSASEGTSLICSTYILPLSGPGKVILRAFSPQSEKAETKSITTMKKLKSDSGRIQIGSSLAGQAYWTGTLRHLTVSPEGISPATWRAICNIPDGAPDPLNTNALDRGLLVMDGR